MSGRVVILNGQPRSGKSSIAAALAERDGRWVRLGVDDAMSSTPARLQPGLGLRPDAGRPDLEPFVEEELHRLYRCVAGHARDGRDVVVDVGHHTTYVAPLNPWQIAAAELGRLAVLVVGVRCPIEIVMRRRRDTWGVGTDDRAAVERWEHALHGDRIYDLEVDTGALAADCCAALIEDRLRRLGPTELSSR